MEEGCDGTSTVEGTTAVWTETVKYHFHASHTLNVVFESYLIIQIMEKRNGGYVNQRNKNIRRTKKPETVHNSSVQSVR